MISICIPIYNKNCIQLVKDLLAQINELNRSIEVICIDDKSNEDYRSLNSSLSNLCKYIMLDENIGRAKIRNRFLQLAKYEWLLFLDNNVTIDNKNFLKCYLENILNFNYDVYLGNTAFFAPKNISKNNNICYNYLIKKTKYKLNNNQVYACFNSKNFLVNKKVLQKVKFNETLIKYGHEDTEFGFNLKLNNFKIKVIDNKVNCIATDDNYTFLYKTHQAIDNLVTILNQLNYNKEFIEDVILLKFYYKYKYILQSTFYFQKRFINFIYKQLLKGNESIILLDYYKLLLLIKKLNKKEK